MDRAALVAELRERITRLSAGASTPRAIDGMKVFTTTRTTMPLGTVSEPAFAVVVGGVKQSALGDRVYEYGAGQFLVLTLDLPLVSHVASASESDPFIGFSMSLDRLLVAQLLVEAPSAPASGEAVPGGPAIAVSDTSVELLDAVARLLRLRDSPADRRMLDAAVRREIHWRLLTGEQGALVREIGLADGRHGLVARGIIWIKEHYDEVIRLEELADLLGLSVSSLSRYFRAATSMSPLQYQKQLRLQGARLRLLTDPGDVAGVGHAVGYASASQFTREYRRMFGAPPSEDIRRLQGVATVVD